MKYFKWWGVSLLKKGRDFLLLFLLNCRRYIPAKGPYTAQKMKFSIKDFFSKCHQIRRKLRKLWIWSHLLKKSLTENFIFCAVIHLRRPHGRGVGGLEICHVFADFIDFKQKICCFIFGDGQGGRGHKIGHFFWTLLMYNSKSETLM